MGAIVFWLCAIVAVLGALLVVVRTSPVNSAMSLIATLFVLAVLYIQLSAHFVAVIQVLVYAGAIMVLFLFVIMLLSLTPEELKRGRLEFRRKLLTSTLVILSAGLIISMIGGNRLGLAWPRQELPLSTRYLLKMVGTLEAIGMRLFQQYLYPFEILSFVLLVAVIGAVLIAKRRLE